MSLPMRGYPYLPREATTGLLLYGCAFKGENDGRWFAEDGIEQVTVVDIDAARIEGMRQLYPAWEYVCADALRFASDANKRQARYDVVSVDPFSNDADLVYAAILPILIPITKLVLVVGIDNKNVEHARGMGAEIIGRSRSFSWAVWA